MNHLNLPRAAPVFVSDNPGGAWKATLTQTRPKSAFFKGQPPNIFEEIVGDDRLLMDEHLSKVLAWLKHYDAYYNMEGWVYEIKWKEVKPRKAKK